MALDLCVDLQKRAAIGGAIAPQSDSPPDEPDIEAITRPSAEEHELYENIRKTSAQMNEQLEKLRATEQNRIDKFEQLKKDDAESVAGLQVARLTDAIFYTNESDRARADDK